jgi:hypothetical protein
MEAFRLKAFDLNRHVVQLKHSEIIKKKMLELQEALNTLSEKGEISDDNKRVLYEEWKDRAKFAVSPPAGPMTTFARHANRVAFIGTIGFNASSAIVNLTQIPMVVYPYMAGKTSWKDAGRHLRTAGRLFGNAGLSHTVLTMGKDGKSHTTKSGTPSIDNYYIVQKNGDLNVREDLDEKIDRAELEEIKPIVEAMMKHALLNRSIFYDTVGNESSGKHNSLWDNVSAKSAYLFHVAERMNRQVAHIAGYLNEMQRLKENPLFSKDKDKNEIGLTHEQRVKRATEIAMHDTQKTNGGAILTTAPRWAQKDLFRISMMYKAFGIQMYYTQANLARQMFKGETEQYRKIARDQFIGVQMGVLAMAGISGLTLFGMGTALWDLLLTEDDELPAETRARQYLGEGLWGCLT